VAIPIVLAQLRFFVGPNAFFFAVVTGDHCAKCYHSVESAV
jgi:hypothetical protein